MAKKERKEEIVFSPADDVAVEEEKPMYETEAYGAPKPDAGSDVTVMKQVGIGGPVPIVAPKHNTIQLQPIVVPLAVVPYMTQDSNILRTDGKQQAQYGENESEEAAKFENIVDKKKSKNRQAKFSRLFSFVSLLVALVIEVPFILSYFNIPIAGENLSYMNVIGFFDIWVHGGDVYNTLYAALYVATFIFDGIIALILLISVVIGKFPRAMVGAFSFIAFGASLAIIIVQIIKNQFAIDSSKILIALTAITLCELLLAIIFSLVLNHIEDQKEKEKVSEI